MLHWYGKQRAKVFVRSMFHVKPEFEIPLIDVMTHRAPTVHVIGAGIAGGIVIWTIPLALYALGLLLNVLVVLMAGAGYRLPTVLADVPTVLVGSLPYVTATGILGGVLAWLRRWSASRNKYFTFLGMRLGLNTIVATALGLCVSALFYEIVIFLGPFLFIIGFLFDGLWEGIYNLILARVCRPQLDNLLAEEVHERIRQHSDWKQFELNHVRIENRKAIITGTGIDPKLRHDMQEALREIEGVSTIVFERDATQVADELRTSLLE